VSLLADLRIASQGQPVGANTTGGGVPAMSLSGAARRARSPPRFRRGRGVCGRSAVPSNSFTSFPRATIITAET
jgi:hypothetical protein